MKRQANRSPLSEYVTVAQAAALLGYAWTDSVRWLIHHDKLPALKLGRDWFILKRDLAHYQTHKAPQGRKPRKTPPKDEN